MTRTRDAAGRTGERSPVLPVLACAVVVFAAVLATWDAVGHPWTVTAVPASATTHADGWAEQDAPDPVRVRSDAVDITSEMIPLGKRDDGALEVPDDAHTAGWWTGRANPGERGPAIIVGHVDSRHGPGAFWELPDLADGDRVSVDREDGTSVHWRVERVEVHPKDDFPTDEVYGDTDEPTLRLVTCSGFFDPQARSYTDNTIVFLTLDDEQDVGPQRSVPHGAHGQADVADDLEPASGFVEPDVSGDGPVTDAGTTASGFVAGVVEPGSDERRVPIALAALSLLAASGAVGREWCVRR